MAVKVKIPDLETYQGRLKLAYILRQEQLRCEQVFGEGFRSASFQDLQGRIEGNIGQAIGMCNGNIDDRRELLRRIKLIEDTYDPAKHAQAHSKLYAIRNRVLLTDAEIPKTVEGRLDLYVTITKVLQIVPLQSDEYRRLSERRERALAYACTQTCSDLLRVGKMLEDRGIKVTIDAMQDALKKHVHNPN